MELVPSCKYPGLLLGYCGHSGLCLFWAFLGLGTDKSHRVWCCPLSLCPHSDVWVANTSGKIYDLEEKKKEKTRKNTTRHHFPGCLPSVVETFLPVGSCGKAVLVPERVYPCFPLSVSMCMESGRRGGWGWELGCRQQWDAGSCGHPVDQGSAAAQLQPPSPGHALCTLVARPLLSEMDSAPLIDGGSLEGCRSLSQRWACP